MTSKITQVMVGLSVIAGFEFRTVQASDPKGELLVPAAAPILAAPSQKPPLAPLPIPPNTPLRRFVVGQGVVDGGAAGATGIEVYNNPGDTQFFFPPGAGNRWADDFRTACLSNFEMTFLEFNVHGGGDGTGPGFTVQFELFDRCPNDPIEPGVPIEGTQGQASLPDDGMFQVTLDLGSTPVELPPRFWLAMTFSTNTAGPELGATTTIGDSFDGFDGIFACITNFGGCPPNPCGNFQGRIFGVEGSCETMSYRAYRADNVTAFFFADGTADWVADDVLPISAPGNCTVSAYDVVLNGVGQYIMDLEIFTHDDATGAPGVPVLNTRCRFFGSGQGTGESYVTAHCDVLPAAFVPSPRMWVTYQRPNTSPIAGPRLLANLPEFGETGDCFSIYGDPEDGEWSPCIWWFGGCPENPCGGFQIELFCTGTEPMGSCCDVLTAGSENCLEDIAISQCGGRFIQGSACAGEIFDPPCGTGSCCMSSESCENMTASACRAADGLWQSAAFCGEEEFSCPPAACIGATNSCFEENLLLIGCENVNCCQHICGVDEFCCQVGWDENCAEMAINASECQAGPSNNICENAEPVSDGNHLFSSLSASTDGPALAAGCNDGFGTELVNDIWFDYTAAVSGSVMIDLCSDTDLDSRIAVYSSCSCPVMPAQALTCDDDDCGEMHGPSRVQFEVSAGQCYKIRIGGAPGPNASGVGTMTITSEGNPNQCPSGAVTFVNPPAGVVDARQPNPVGNLMPRQGIRTFTVTAPAGAAQSCWRMCETAMFPGEPNSIQSVTADGTNYTIELARPITPAAVTRIAYNPDGKTPAIAAFISHPGNINGDGTAAPNDVLRLIDCLNNVNPPMNCPWGVYSSDADQSGMAGPADILRAIDLLNGAGVFEIWNGTPLPSGTCNP